MRDALKLFWYNHFRRHWSDYWFRRRYMAEWVAEGRDPARMPRLGKITPEVLQWARDWVQKHDLP